jgi:hypothetical protein
MLLVFLVPAAIAKNPVGPFYKIREFVLHTKTTNNAGVFSCSATAIGPSVILTATHCERPGGVLSILRYGSPSYQPVEVVSVIRDKADHSVLFLKGIVFEKYARFTGEHPEIGQVVYVLGFPDVANFQYRMGIVASMDVKGLPIFDGLPSFLVGILSYVGDSGSAIFDDNGDIVGVVSFGTPHLALGALMFRFTADELISITDGVLPISVATGLYSLGRHLIDPVVANLET